MKKRLTFHDKNSRNYVVMDSKEDRAKLRLECYNVRYLNDELIFKVYINNIPIRATLIRKDNCNFVRVVEPTELSVLLRLGQAEKTAVPERLKNYTFKDLLDVGLVRVPSKAGYIAEGKLMDVDIKGIWYPSGVYKSLDTHMKHLFPFLNKYKELGMSNPVYEGLIDGKLRFKVNHVDCDNPLKSIETEKLVDNDTEIVDDILGIPPVVYDGEEYDIILIESTGGDKGEDLSCNTSINCLDLHSTLFEDETAFIDINFYLLKVQR